MKPVIVAIAKLESAYIEEWVKYHLTLGFEHIYLYDNDDQPTYATLLQKYSNYVTVYHRPGNNYHKGIQFIVLEDFYTNIMPTNGITHVTHIDIDEFIVLKKHNNIKDFIQEYITGDCAGIGINWRYFGSSGHTEASPEPVTVRFTKCDLNGNRHVKTIFAVEDYQWFDNQHYIYPKKGKFIKNTLGEPFRGPFNEHIDFSVAQLNHYKTKTYPEYVHIRSRGRAGPNIEYQKAHPENVAQTFKAYDRNDTEDLTAKVFYETYVAPKTF